MQIGLVGAILSGGKSDEDLIKIFGIDKDRFILLKNEILRIEDDIGLCDKKRDVLYGQLDKANLIKYGKQEIDF